MLDHTLELQIDLEKLFAKNHTMTRIKDEFDRPEVREHAEAWEIPYAFALDLMCHLVLHRRASMSVLVGILHRKHFGDESEDLQACCNMVIKATQAGFAKFDGMSLTFIFVADITEETHRDLERFQYPMPMIVQPMDVIHNRCTGYVTIPGSAILQNNHTDDDICLDHLNRSNQVALTLNADTARMVKNNWRNLDKKKPGEKLEDYQERVTAFEKYDSTSREVMEVLFMNGGPIYFTHAYDKRGRTYARGYHANPQGNPWNKACLEFANQEVTT